MNHQHNGPGSAALHQIADGVYAWVQPDGTWWLNNAGLVTGDSGSLLIDTCATETRTRRLLAAVADVTDDAPIRWALNTHQHGDHTYGNSLLPESTVLIGHRAMRAALLADPILDACPPFWSPRPNWGRVRRRVPELVLDSQLSIVTGRRRVDLRHPGFAAHTTGDVVAWLPAERVLFTGDLIFHGLTPLVFMGNLDGALRSLDWLAGFDPEHVVPGHGSPFGAATWTAVLAAHERYYRLVQATATNGIRAKATVLEAAAACDLGEFAHWADAERLVLNLHRAYADATGIQFDMAAALTDATTWNRGPLSTSV